MEGKSILKICKRPRAAPPWAFVNFKKTGMPELTCLKMPRSAPLRLSGRYFKKQVRIKSFKLRFFLFYYILAPYA